jgi:hypothetical protein
MKVTLFVVFSPQILWIVFHCTCRRTGTITRTKDCRRYLPVHDICSMLGSVLCRVLPAAHALTWCDTTSSFFGVGKKTMYKVLKDSQKEFVDLNQISCDDIEISVAVDRKFVSRLYDPKARFTCDHFIVPVVDINNCTNF